MVKIYHGNYPVENYPFPQLEGALKFSPDCKKIIFNAAFQSWNTQPENLPDSELAIIVYNFEDDKGDAVLYDDTDTRMKNFSYINYEWFKTYF